MPLSATEQQNSNSFIDSNDNLIKAGVGSGSTIASCSADLFSSSSTRTFDATMDGRTIDDILSQDIPGGATQHGGASGSTALFSEDMVNNNNEAPRRTNMQIDTEEANNAADATNAAADAEMQQVLAEHGFAATGDKVLPPPTPVRRRTEQIVQERKASTDKLDGEANEMVEAIMAAARKDSGDSSIAESVNNSLSGADFAATPGHNMKGLPTSSAPPEMMVGGKPMSKGFFGKGKGKNTALYEQLMQAGKIGKPYNKGKGKGFDHFGMRDGPYGKMGMYKGWKGKMNPYGMKGDGMMMKGKGEMMPMGGKYGAPSPMLAPAGAPGAGKGGKFGAPSPHDAASPPLNSIETEELVNDAVLEYLGIGLDGEAKTHSVQSSPGSAGGMDLNALLGLSNDAHGVACAPVRTPGFGTSSGSTAAPGNVQMNITNALAQAVADPTISDGAVAALSQLLVQTAGEGAAGANANANGFGASTSLDAQQLLGLSGSPVKPNPATGIMPIPVDSAARISSRNNTKEAISSPGDEWFCDESWYWGEDYTSDEYYWAPPPGEFGRESFSEWSEGIDFDSRESVSRFSATDPISELSSPVKTPLKIPAKEPEKFSPVKMGYSAWGGGGKDKKKSEATSDAASPAVTAVTARTTRTSVNSLSDFLTPGNGSSVNPRESFHANASLSKCVFDKNGGIDTFKLAQALSAASSTVSSLPVGQLPRSGGPRERGGQQKFGVQASSDSDVNAILASIGGTSMSTTASTSPLGKSLPVSSTTVGSVAPPSDDSWLTDLLSGGGNNANRNSAQVGGGGKPDWSWASGLV